MTGPDHPGSTAPVARDTPELLLAIGRSVRPRQWIKNGVVLAALLFGDRLLDPGSVARALAAMFVFCLISSAIYLINDVRDVTADRLHPVKRRRPVAAGTLNPDIAVGASLAFTFVGLTGAVLIGPVFALCALAYFVLMVGYSFRLKSLVVLDVIVIAIGFVLRAAAGAVAIDVAISPWLLICTFLLALFLGFGKRRHELLFLADGPAHRANLARYSMALLDALTTLTAIAAVLSYALYTVERRGDTGDWPMVLTTAPVAYAVGRYWYLMRRREGGGSPESTLLGDWSLVAAVAIWGIACVVILYPR